MSCANFQELLAGQGAATATDFTPANIDFPYDSDDELRLDIYNYEDQQWVNVPLATGATIDVGGAGDRFYAWETYLTNGQTGVRTILATAGTTPALPVGGTASHPLAPANNNYPVQGGTGVNVRLYRQTSIEAGEMPAYFYPGASIRAQDLNDNFEALRKVVEESNCGTNNVTDAAPLLDQRYWNKLNDTVESGDAWIDDDNHIATTAAGDDRWLGIPGGGGTTLTAGAGIDLTGTTLSADLEAAGAGTGGLVFDPATGDTGEIRVNVNNGLELTANGVEVDLADPSGLEFTGGDLRIDVNDGCEIVAAGLNAETTDASIVQTGGTDADPAIRVATTLGTTTTNNDLAIVGGANVTVTRNNDNQLTIASAAATGGATFRGTVDVDNNNTLPGTTGQQNPNAVNVGDGFTVENNVAAADVTANWNTVLDNWDTADGIINSGDVILCITAAAAGSPTDARYNLVRTGGNINTLQQVLTAGNHATTDITLGNTAADPRLTLDESTGGAQFDGDVTIGGANNRQIQLFAGGIVEIDRPAGDGNGNVFRTDLDGNRTITFLASGGAHFNANNLDTDFRVDGDTNDNVFFVDASTDRVGIGRNNPGRILDVDGSSFFRGQMQIIGGNDFAWANTNNNQTVAINADDATQTYNMTLPPTRPTAANRFLAAAGTGTGADQELEWVAGAAALWEADGNFLRPVANDDGIQIRDSDATDVSTELDREGGAHFNQQQNDVDFRIRGDTVVDLFFVDGGNNRVGLGTNVPDTLLDVAGTVSIAQNAITAVAGSWNLANGNFWTLGAVVVPNPTNIVAGVSGLIVNTAAATWPAAGGAVFQYAANTPPNITEFPAVIPFYCTNNTTIFIGTPTVNIT